ncbi:MAG TPA: DUF4291 domain-containing protein [Ruminococcus sp.]|nr:DUF4291 domain-containing protein [Ruminococcus sp.]
MKCRKEIYAYYNREHIRVYQAYNKQIAEQAVSLQTFGNNFSLNRMTWIKPSFLWLMYRSNWGTKKNQEYILALDIYREAFDSLLEGAVLTSPEHNSDSWEKDFKETTVYCQWDNDRNINGKALNRYAIQIGIKSDILKDFISSGIYKITDLTPSVKKWNEQRKSGKTDLKNFPAEKIYPVNNQDILKRLDMI